MAEYKYITQAQYKAASASAVRVVKQHPTATVGGYFLDYIKDYLLHTAKFSEDQLRFGGYKIYTTLDLDDQRNAERTMTELPKIAKAKTQPQGALVSLDVKTGEILAMVGGRSYAESQYNRSILSYRQPGSSIKPFVYATAIEKGYTPASSFEDKPLSIQLENGTIWSPDNYDHLFRGTLTLRAALRNSVNTVAVQLLQSVGVQSVAEQMERMGISSLVKEGKNNDITLAPLALGGLTKGVTPLELAAAYLPFPNLGVYIQPTGIKKVVNHSGKTVRRYAHKKKAVLSAETSYIMTMLMKDVVEQGTGHRARLGQYPAAGKTGTTNDNTNAWFVGFTPQVVTAIWIGNDRQGSPMYGIGSSTAAQMWGSYMKSAMSGHPVTDFIQPPGIVWADVDPKTGLAVPGFLNHNTYQEVFNAKNVPASNSYKVWNWFFPEKQTPDSDKPVGDDQPAQDPLERF
jgi:penicillin-binding protein 1A